MFNFTFRNPQYVKSWLGNGKQTAVEYVFEYSKSLKKLLMSLKDQYSEIGDNLESLYYETDNVHDRRCGREDQKRYIICEIGGHRTHFSSGLPKYLRGTGLGTMLYVNFIKFIGYGRSCGDSSVDAQDMWKKIAQRREFYGISTHSDVLVIDKNIIGKEKPFDGRIDSTWLYSSKDSNVYTESDIYIIIMKFMKIQNVYSLQDMNIDPELIKNFPNTEKRVNDLLKINKVEKKQINIKDLLRLKERDYVKLILDSGKEYILCILNVYKNVPGQPKWDEEMIECSDEYMRDRYNYVINIPNNTLSKRTPTDGDKFEFVEKIKEIYYIGGKPK